MLVRQPSRWGRVAAVDWSAHAERVVLTAVLGIAALISYTHLREVWVHSGAPWEALGPLLVDGLFAAAWLRMRRRRRDGVPVGWLAWTALGLALAGTLAGNLAAAWVTGHRDPLALVVAAVPAVAFALVWELVTGHGRRPAPARPPAPLAQPGAGSIARQGWTVPPAAPGGPDRAAVGAPSPAVARPVAREIAQPDPAATPAPGDTRVGELLAAGAGRRKIAQTLGVTEYEARQLIAQHTEVGG